MSHATIKHRHPLAGKKKLIPYTHQFDELEHLEYSRVQEIVAAVVARESVENGREQVALDDVTIVKLVLERDDLAHEPEGAEHEERVGRLHQDEYLPEQILVENAVLDVIGVVLDAERQELEDQTEQLDGAVVLAGRSLADRVCEEGSYEGADAVLVEVVEEVGLLRLVHRGHHVLRVEEETQHAGQLHGAACGVGFFVSGW